MSLIQTYIGVDIAKGWPSIQVGRVPSIFFQT